MTSDSRDPYGTEWNIQEVELVVDDYFEMFRLERQGQKYNKAEHNRLLQKLTRRTRTSIEKKHQNISAILGHLGLPSIGGYKPLANFQQSLLDAIERYLSTHGVPQIDLPHILSAQESTSLFIESPPTVSLVPPMGKVDITRLLHKFDPAARDARNRDLGQRGEEYAFENEIRTLRNAGREDLARKARHVSKEDGDGLGYDIHSYDLNGGDRLIEVKTTLGDATTPFFISENERLVSIERKTQFKLLRLYDFTKSPRAFEIVPPLDDFLFLQPTSYRATFGKPHNNLT
jgi:Domain of unknown function (DUF3883)